VPRAAINPPQAVAIGPYSAAVAAGDLLFLSGQTPLDPATGKLLQGDVRAQTAQCFANLFAVLGAST
jgi:2-iminobutanoate/2-iminopropanoate deaminase